MTVPLAAARSHPAEREGRLRFDRNELSGAFGDIGTDFPLIVGMTLAARLDVASVFIMFGAMQVLTGLAYGIPMPAQPLKAMAILVITQHVSGPVLYGGGLAIGITMLALTGLGILGALARAIPKPVVRGIQFGLGLQLASLALGDYLRADGWPGYALGAVSFVVVVTLLGNRRYPPAPFAILIGVLYAVASSADPGSLVRGFGVSLPTPRVPSAADIGTGFLVLALPQIPLSLGNSILATQQIATDLFPRRAVTISKIGFTYAGMNLINPFFGGVPTCHGSGGMAGHYTFGARTGGSVVIYGAMYLAAGLFLASSFDQIVRLFPKPILGVILLFEALALLQLVRDMAERKADFAIVVLVGVLAVSLPYGYLIALVTGTVLAHLITRGFTGLAG